MQINIQGRQIRRIRGLVVPINPYLAMYPGIRIDHLHIDRSCDSCKQANMLYYCRTEGIYTCGSCNGFCENKAHVWEPLRVDLPAKATLHNQTYK